MNYDKINPETIRSIRRYADEHCPAGDFLRAVLENDLKEAVMRADHDNRAVLPEIVAYCHNEIPHNCWGSPAKVWGWLQAGQPLNFRKGEDRVMDARALIQEYHEQKMRT